MLYEVDTLDKTKNKKRHLSGHPLPESTGVKMLAKSGRNFQSLEAH